MSTLDPDEGIPTLDDVVLGAYVDGELDAESRAQVEAAARSSPEIRRRIDAIRQVTGAVREVYRKRLNGKIEPTR